MSGRFSAVVFAISLAVGSVAVAQDPILTSSRQLRESGEIAAALTLLQQKLERDGSSPALMAELGLTEVDLERWSEGARHLRVALEASGDSHVRRHRTELEEALAKAERELGSASSDTAPAPSETAPAEAPPSSDNPFAADAAPGAQPPLPMPGETAPDPQPPEEPAESPSPGSEAIPPSLRQTLGGGAATDAPLVRTEWHRAIRGLPLVGLFAVGTYSFGKVLAVGESEPLSQGQGHEGGVRFGMELNLPLVGVLYGAVRVFGGLLLPFAEGYSLVRSESLSDPNFEHALTYGTDYSDAPALPIFGLELLARIPLGTLVFGAGARLAASTRSGEFDTSETYVFLRGDTCDYSRPTPTPPYFLGELGSHYGCSADPTRLPPSESQRFRDYRMWWLDVQGLIELDWSPMERFAMRLTVGLGRPAISMSLGFVVGLGPILGGDR